MTGLQFSLKRLFLLSLMVAIFFAGRASVQHQAHRDRINLRVPVTMHFQDTPVREALVDLGRQANLSVRFDNRGLGERVVRLERLVSADIDDQHISLASAMTLMLNAAELGYYVNNHTLIITSEADAELRRQRNTSNRPSRGCGVN